MPDGCADRTLALGEPLLGSAGSSFALVAIAWPKPHWHHDEAARSRGLPPEIRELQDDAKARGRKIDVRLFQCAPGRPAEPTELICVSAAGARSLHRTGVAAHELAGLAARFLEGDDAGPPLAQTHVLVCTDGKHDRCCATYGRAVYDALAGAARERDPEVRVVESSHLGGHRFAANCLVLPEARAYGQLRPADAEPLLDAVLRGQAWLPRYRGRFGLDEPSQIAEARVLEHHPRAIGVELDRAPSRDGGGPVTVRFESDGAAQRATIAFRPEPFTGVASCGPEAEPETRQRWRGDWLG